MTLGKNKRVPKKKGKSRKIVDPFTRKEWFDLKAPKTFKVTNIGKTPVNKTQGNKHSSDALKGRVFESSLGDLNQNEDAQYAKFKLRVDDVQGKNCLTNFHAMSFTSDKLKSLVRKWQSLIEGNLLVNTSDGYTLRLFCIAFTKKRQNQIKKTSYAQSSKVRQIRKKMFEVVTREVASGNLKELIAKLIPNAIGKEIEKECHGIYPLKDVYVSKVKIVKAPKLDGFGFQELHGESSADAGSAVKRA
uniref:Small ribosomal subunit protein eS1 n=1 Tax=Lotus japonicus TaxID=34305 RepID=I3S2C2_LOTJA|nr:unknown [Lotus japonicus]